MNTGIDEVEKSHMNGIDQISNKIIEQYPKLRTDILRYKQYREKQTRPTGEKNHRISYYSTNIYNKESVLKPAREKTQVTHKRKPMKITADFST